MEANNRTCNADQTQANSSLPELPQSVIIQAPFHLRSKNSHECNIVYPIIKQINYQL